MTWSLFSVLKVNAMPLNAGTANVFSCSGNRRPQMCTSDGHLGGTLKQGR